MVAAERSGGNFAGEPTKHIWNPAAFMHKGLGEADSEIAKGVSPAIEHLLRRREKAVGNLLLHEAVWHPDLELGLPRQPREQIKCPAEFITVQVKGGEAGCRSGQG